MYKSLAVQLQSTAESGHGRQRQHLGLSALATCGRIELTHSVGYERDWNQLVCHWWKNTCRRYILCHDFPTQFDIMSDFAKLSSFFFFWHGEPVNSMVKPTIPQTIITSNQSQLSEPRLILTDCPKCCDGGCSKSTRWCALWQTKLFSNILDNISRMNVTLNRVPHSLAFYAARAMSHASFCF